MIKNKSEMMNLDNHKGNETKTEKRIEENDFKVLGFPTKSMYEFPNIVNVEVFRGICPCNCVHCPVGEIEPKDRKEFFGEKGIDLKLYERIVTEISKHPNSTIRIHSVGDPIVWKDLKKAAEITRESNVISWIFTSAVTRDKSVLESLCKNIDIIEVSVNSKDSGNYLETKGVDAFDLVAENIGYMHDFIKKNLLNTRLIVSRVQSLDEAYDKEFLTYWKNSGLVEDAFIRSYHTYNDLLEKHPGDIKKAHEPCRVHWSRFNISVDGKAIICFNELFKRSVEPSLILGDLNKSTISDIWKGQSLNSLREAEISGNYDNILFKSLPCKDCYSCQPLNTDRNTSEFQIRKLINQ